MKTEREFSGLLVRILFCSLMILIARRFEGKAKTAADHATFYVATYGNNHNTGGQQAPFATLSRARAAVRELKKTAAGAIKVYVRAGTYYLAEPLVFGPEDSGTERVPITYAAYPGELVTISGGRKLDCQWRPYKDGIMMCNLPALKAGEYDFSQLFINGKRQIRARFPNYENSIPGISGYIYPKGSIPDEAKAPFSDPNSDMTFSGISPRGIIFDAGTFTPRRWAKPEEAVIHIFQEFHWCNLQWTIRAIDYTNNRIWFGRGGHQGKVGSVDRSSQFYVENVFEELDAPGEWYLDKDKGVLYHIPAEGIDLKTALVEAPILQQVVRFIGTQDTPVSHITLEGFRIAHTASTFLERYSVPSRGDWSIHRGGTVFLEGTRDCTVKDCWFDAVGGNAVFMNNYNRDNAVTGCKFTQTGDSAICFVGALESTIGTFRNFPFQCRASNNLIHDCGAFGKQIAGVYISRAKRITAAHNLIYNMPRAGICIGDGTWGGHIIEANEIHHAVQETSDHGPFNSWGREGFWCPTQAHNKEFAFPHQAGNVKEYAEETTIVRNNYLHSVAKTYEWGSYLQALDLDDGTSNFHVYNNLCVGMGISIREGDFRTVENNIIIDPVVPFAIHYGFDNNNDIVRRNIIYTTGDIFHVSAVTQPYLKEMNNNLFYSPRPPWSYKPAITIVSRNKNGISTYKKLTLAEWQELGYDKDSLIADPMFIDPARNDYRVKPESPALKLGFKNFEMGKWGLTDEFPAQWRN
ncbi:MAG: right-handed parallel beta-helix repeat-containing protein [Candidatus Aminicenantales bacterium]